MRMTEHPWETSYPDGIVWDLALSPQPAETALINAAQAFPERKAIDFYGHDISYAELLALSARAAAGFQAHGVGPGRNVGLHLANTPHYLICFFGVLMAGGAVVNFSPMAAVEQLRRQLIDSEVELFVTLDIGPLYAAAAPLKGSGKLRSLVVCSLRDFLPDAVATMMGGPAPARDPADPAEVDFSALIANEGDYAVPERGPLEHEMAVLQYTGGTTGEPKGAILTHANLSAVIDITRHWLAGPMGEGVNRVLMVLPLFHMFGIAVMVPSVATGTEMVLMLRFDPTQVLAEITQKKITNFFGVPTMYAALVHHPRLAEFDISSLRLCGSGGAPMLSEIQRRFRELTGLTPIEGYSLTETAAMGTLESMVQSPRLGTVGLPLPRTLVEIVDIETGLELLPVGMTGEICFTGPQVMKGYWKRPEANAEAFRGGRFHSGDLGFLDADGYVTLVDRKKDLIITGGYNVFPRNVEEAIQLHPAVAEVMVVGLPNRDLGQIAKGFIVLTPGHEALSYNELRAFLAGKLAAPEMPVEIEIRPSLPKTPLGKLSKKDLLAEIDA